MLSHIYRLIKDFEQDHGIHPNLLFLNKEHCQYLDDAFSNEITMQEIMQLLHMELVIENDIMHPHVCWTHVAQERMVS